MKEWFKARNVWGAAITALTDEEAGRLAKAIWAYTMDGEIVDLQGAGKGIFAMILMTLGQDEEHDFDVSAKRSIAGRSKRVLANDSNCNQMISNDIKSKQVISIADNKNKNKSKNKEQEEEKELLFDRFWAVYPRHESKQNARKAFDKLKPDEELVSTMIAAVERQKGSAQWQENGGQYIPHPATWINGRRWEDELTRASPKPGAYEQRDYAGEQDEAMRRMIAAMKEGT